MQAGSGGRREGWEPWYWGTVILRLPIVFEKLQEDGSVAFLTSLLPRPKPLITLPLSRSGKGGSGPLSGPTIVGRGPSGRIAAWTMCSGCPNGLELGRRHFGVRMGPEADDFDMGDRLARITSSLS